MQDKQYINDKGEVKDVKSMNSFELVNGFAKYHAIAVGGDDIEKINIAVINRDLTKAELLERLDTRKLQDNPLIASDTVKPEGNESIMVNFSDEDLEDLQNGGTFDWTFISDRGNNIDIHLYKGDEEEEDEDDELNDRSENMKDVG